MIRRLAFEQIGHGQAGVLVQLLCYLLFFVRAQIGAQSERVRVGSHCEFFHVLQKRLKSGRLLGQLLVVPGRGRIGGQRQHVGQIHAGVAAGGINIGGEVEDLREQNHAVQVDARAWFSRMLASTAERVVP